MKATATAKVLTGNATQCMRPFGIMDKWDEYNVATNGAEYEYNTQTDKVDPDWDFLNSTYDNYDSKGEDYPAEGSTTRRT